MGEYPTRFSNTRELCALPWFDLVDGRLVRDPSFGLAIDVHTHLALAYLLPQKIDLLAEYPQTQHYLPLHRPLDLDVYANRNFSEGDLSTLERDLSIGSLTAGGLRRTHTLPNLAREMQELGVKSSVLLAIDFPALSDNAGDWLAAARGRDDFVVFGSVHPFRRQPERELDRQVLLGAKGIKVHPAAQLVHPSAERSIRLYRECAKRCLPVLWHCGPVGIEPRLGRYLSRVRHYGKAIESCPDTTFVLGHTGALEVDEAIELARAHDNVWVETSSQSVSAVRKILSSVNSDRILLGSDWPFYHQSMPLAKLFIAADGDDALIAKVLRENATRLLSL